MAVNHAWNIEKQRNKALRAELKKAMDNNEHNRITSLANDVRASDAKLEKLLKDQK